MQKRRMTYFTSGYLLLALVFSTGGNSQPSESSTRRASAAANVHLLPPMEMPELQRQRSIRLYLPPGYYNSSKRYPVLYMHDGQNLFDDRTSYVGEWQVDETLNRLAKQGKLELIVIGIDHGGDKRMQELSPWTNQDFGEAQGEQYARFIVDKLKPYIDQHYRTLPDRQHTAVMGSSMGGLMSHYMLAQYPQVFGKAGIFSPSYWYSDQVSAFVRTHPLPEDSRLYLLVGGREGQGMQTDMLAMYQRLLAMHHPKYNLFAKVNLQAQHNEAFWRSEFAQAIQWLFCVDSCQDSAQARPISL